VYVSRTANSCTLPQSGQSTVSFLDHDARKLCTSVWMPVGVSQPPTLGARPLPVMDKGYALLGLPSVACRTNPVNLGMPQILLK
jgi:hypothetical protein